MAKETLTERNVSLARLSIYLFLSFLSLVIGVPLILVSVSSSCTQRRSVDVPFSDWCRRVPVAGYCYCIVCNQRFNYGSNGKKVLRDHADHPKHRNAYKTRNSCTSILTTSGGMSVGVSSMAERMAEEKATLLAFLAEHSLPFSLAPDLLDVARRLAEDKKALEKTNLSRTSATYTLTHGLGSACKQELDERLRSTPFSFNLDEATDNANDKDALLVYCYAFLSKEEQQHYQICYRPVIDEVLKRRDVGERERQRIRELQLMQGRQTHTSEGQTRKDVILTALFKDGEKFFTVVNLIRGGLILLLTLLLGPVITAPLLQEIHPLSVKRDDWGHKIHQAAEG
ncbi:hypothetical protein BaRGS_00004538 [Batillaria attramentaria]|uniref:Uncharacterized protein n=1 Tax=Batillaria attramentaria TaxID=370345 RepID=A0ABD0LZ12_9CAEN